MYIQNKEQNINPELLQSGINLCLFLQDALQFGAKPDLLAYSLRKCTLYNRDSHT